MIRIKSDFLSVSSVVAVILFFQTGNVNLRKSALKSTTPSDEIVRLDINHDGKPDILERWWNGKRVRWLDENADMLPTDTRGDQVGDVMQIDKNGDGIYDSETAVSYTHLRAHETPEHLVCRLLLE